MEQNQKRKLPKHNIKP